MRSASPRSTHSARGSFSAAVRFITPSARCATHTAPIPPSASSRSSRHGPMRSPGRSRRIADSAAAASCATVVGGSALAKAVLSDCVSRSSSIARRCRSSSPSVSSQAARSAEPSASAASSNRLRRCQSSMLSDGRTAMVETHLHPLKDAFVAPNRTSNDTGAGRDDASMLVEAIHVALPPASAQDRGHARSRIGVRLRRRADLGPRVLHEAQSLDRVVITGSRSLQIDRESALLVQIIR